MTTPCARSSRSRAPTATRAGRPMARASPSILDGQGAVLPRQRGHRHRRRRQARQRTARHHRQLRRGSEPARVEHRRRVFLGAARRRRRISSASIQRACGNPRERARCDRRHQLFVHPDGRAASFLVSSPTSMGEVHVSPLAAFAPRKLTDMTAQLASLVIGRPEVASWKSRDGATIEGC